MSISLSEEYTKLLETVKERVRTAHCETLGTINKELVELYWDIGRMIVEYQDDVDQGSLIAERLAEDLQAEFSALLGFSRRNVFTMRKFYSLYPELTKVNPLSAQIGWSYKTIILHRCKDRLEQEFYVRMARRFGWSREELLRHIENDSFGKEQAGVVSFDVPRTSEMRANGWRTARDEYIFDFLNLADEEREREMETTLSRRVEKFLRAMGGAFSSMGTQICLEVESGDRFIDLLLFHRRLRCLVAVELKAGDFLPELAESMQSCLSALDRQIRQEGENPSIGILLCEEKERIVVKYILPDCEGGSYRILGAKKLSNRFRTELPTPRQLARFLGVSESPDCKID
jgi:predicted nuclease of restriction endonuclease-like (RecB) superfamily